MKDINFCIPFIGVGISYAQYFIENIIATADHPEKISITLSVHFESDVALIKNSAISQWVDNIIMSPEYFPRHYHGSPDPNWHVNVISSGNHSMAIQTLTAQSKADIVIFSDYDMVFTSAGWDTKIRNILREHDLCGVTYPAESFPVHIKEFASLYNIPACKYQGKPNLSFLAINRSCIHEIFGGVLSSFHEFLLAGGIPFQIVNTRQMAEELGLPLASVWAMDTGFELPFIISQKNLKYKVFTPVSFDQQNIFKNANDFLDTNNAATDLPEVFVDDQQQPFLAHFRRGTSKARRNKAKDAFAGFMKGVNDYLAHH